MSELPVKLFSAVFIAGACILWLSCARPPETTKEEPPPRAESRSSPQPAPATSMSNLPPPQPAEVHKAVRRVFKDAVIVDTKSSPYFMVGDFNGDLSQDLVAVVKPTVARLREINDELANWILVDLKKPYHSRPHAGMVTLPARVRVNDGDILVAVIHGFGLHGWRNDQATQTYVLKNAAGAGMKTEARKQVVRPDTQDKLPRIWGDVIAHSVGGQSGFVYYNGAKYAWYDPRTYKPDALARRAHGGMRETMR